MSDEYVLSPLVVVTGNRKAGATAIHAGSGLDRQCVEVESGPAGEEFLAWVLGRSWPDSLSGIVNSLVEELGIPGCEAETVVDELVTAHVLIADVEAGLLRSAITPWAEHGWDDAALFHRATFGQRFDSDTLGEVSYEDYYRWLTSATDIAGRQPPVTPPARGVEEVRADTSASVSPATLRDVLARSAPINRFEGGAIALGQLLDVLRDAFQADRTIGGTLGKHLLKVYPSGGARHPLELYVVAKSVSGLPPSVYHFDVLGGSLSAITNTNITAAAIDTACFGKGGIVTANAVAVLTVRWWRHNWKYRYSRSYRMVLLEVGHAVQAIHLAAVARGVDAYHCPSINDNELMPMLGLDDDCEEGPVYAIGLGTGGVR